MHPRGNARNSVIFMTTGAGAVALTKARGTCGICLEAMEPGEVVV